MTLQERYDAEVAAAQALHQKHAQGSQMMRTLEQDMIRADARMALLEALLKAEAEQCVAPEPPRMTLVPQADPLAVIELEGAANG